MRRVTKKLLILLFGLLFIYCYCEFLIYYVVVAQCTWPNYEKLRDKDPLKAFMLADPHLLGPFRGHWLDKWRREKQMHAAFQAIINLHKPDVVFVLGDLFDEGEWTDIRQFKEYVDRFYQLFTLPEDIKMHVVVGNHDIGFHNKIRQGAAERFTKLLNAPSVQHLVMKNNHFVLINSMALHGDSCNLCENARKSIEKISVLLNCAENPEQCQYEDHKYNYSQPIILQHFPLYRLSDAVCTEDDAPPLPERNKKFRLKIDVLSKEATTFLISNLKPRAVFGGHTHHGCLIRHSYKYENDVKFLEYSVPSFSWRNRPDPKYMLVTISPDEFNVHKCGLPTETTIIITAIIMVLLLIVFLISIKTTGRGFQ